MNTEERKQINSNFWALSGVRDPRSAGGDSLGIRGDAPSPDGGYFLSTKRLRYTLEGITPCAWNYYPLSLAALPVVIRRAISNLYYTYCQPFGIISVVFRGGSPIFDGGYPQYQRVVGDMAGGRLPIYPIPLHMPESIYGR